MEDNKVVRYYDSIADEYDDSRFNNSYGQFIDAEERRILDQLIDVAHPAPRLDVACGTGRLTGYATHALDASKEMMAHARRRHPDVHFCVASAADTGYEAEKFATIYSFHLLMHLDAALIQDIFDECHRILKTGGQLIIDIPSSKRRRLLHHRQVSWHGGTELDKEDILRMTAGKFVLRRRFGIMLLPVHKLPNFMRRALLRLDYALANSFLKPYSSYIVYELIKL